jgi:hypothetical protein
VDLTSDGIAFTFGDIVVPDITAPVVIAGNIISTVAVTPGLFLAFSLPKIGVYLPKSSHPYSFFPDAQSYPYAIVFCAPLVAKYATGLINIAVAFIP